jgi:cytochrome c oxidase assembly protein subunit 11
MSDSPDRHLVWKVAGIGLAMFAFGFALVPLYDVICAVTGFGGKTASAAAVVVAEEPDPSRTVRVELLASVPRGVPFTLEPDVSHLNVHPGEVYETHFRARNLSSSPLRAQAVPSVAPGAAARYFKKFECFCFTSQQFAPNEELELTLSFMVAPELPADVDTLSLSYTYFSAPN